MLYLAHQTERQGRPALSGTHNRSKASNLHAVHDVISVQLEHHTENLTTNTALSYNVRFDSRFNVLQLISLV